MCSVVEINFKLGSDILSVCGKCGPRRDTIGIYVYFNIYIYIYKTPMTEQEISNGFSELKMSQRSD